MGKKTIDKAKRAAVQVLMIYMLHQLDNTYHRFRDLTGPTKWNGELAEGLTQEERDHLLKILNNYWILRNAVRSMAWRLRKE